MTIMNNILSDKLNLVKIATNQYFVVNKILDPSIRRKISLSFAGLNEHREMVFKVINKSVNPKGIISIWPMEKVNVKFLSDSLSIDVSINPLTIKKEDVCRLVKSKHGLKMVATDIQIINVGDKHIVVCMSEDSPLFKNSFTIRRI